MTDPRTFGYWEPITPEDQAMLTALVGSLTPRGWTVREDTVKVGTWHTVRLSKPVAAPPNPLGPSETGVDLSHWNDGGTAITRSEWGLIRANGHRFAFIKRTQGTDFVDPFGLVNFLNALGVMDYLSNYHFFEWRKDGVAQSDWFSLKCGEAAGNLPELVDAELLDGEDPATIDKPRASANLRALLGRNETRWGRKSLIYTNKRSWDNMFVGLDDIAASHDFLIADWTPPLELPRGVRWARFHQKSSTHTIPGLLGPWDLVEYRGNPPPPTPRHEMRDKTNQQVLNLFWATFGSFSQLGRAIPGWATALAGSPAIRAQLYTGPAVEDFDLTAGEKAQLIAALST